MKKNLLITIIVLAVVLLGIGGFFVWRGKRVSQPTLTPEPEGVLIETPLEERPYVTLTPRTDGREFTLDISRIKNAETIEYELVYLTRGLSRGVIGSVDLKEGETVISRKLLLGTCSRGVCKYDEDVTEGTLTLRFRGPDGVRKFVSDFHLQQGGKELTSIDGNFKLEGKLSSGTFYLIMSTVGLPGEFEDEVVRGSYGVFTVGSNSIKNGKVTLTLSEEEPSAKLYAWTGRGWQEVKKGFEIDGKVVSAEIDSLGTFIAAASE